MNVAQTKGRSDWHREAASQHTTDSAKHSSTARRLPAFGRDLVVARRNGQTVPFLVISIGWRFGRAMPRVVVPDDQQLDQLDLSLVAELGCMVVHHDEPARAFEVAAAALAAGATACPIFCMAQGKTTLTTSEIVATLELRSAA
ncbi:hypothetical protein [Thiobacillus denitrificans]|uniref:hypothetical protein n=1 Tax=Thiobacillus denitrificans TaxID=36861 RepID=UPI0012F8B484|nr:hypothetical protein [Thiobacillus denitrificans]